MTQPYKIISFSVWGDSKKYLNGCFENIYIAKKIYPGWITRFYCDDKVDQLFMQKLSNLGAEVKVMQSIKSPWEGLFWRFIPASESEVDVFISRDIDSRLSVREKVAVDEWLKGDKDIHCMRDHIEHNVPILGGMWGCKNGILKNMVQDIGEWNKYDYKGSDQDFLKEYVWEKYKSNIICHDGFSEGFTLEQKVSDKDLYIKQREEYEEYRNRSIKEKNLSIEQRKKEGIIFNKEEIENILPEIPALNSIKTDSDGNILFDYVYDPIKIFGKHDLRPFPKHKKMTYGTYVGEII